MAEVTQSYKDKVQAEKEAVEKATEKYDELLAVLILIATSNRPKKEKIKMIEEQRKKLKNFNKEFSKKEIAKVYKKFSGEAELEIESTKKKLTGSQKKELGNLATQLEIELNKRLDVYVENARKLIIKEELKMLREGELKFKDAQEKRVLSNGKQKTEIIFMDSKGRRITNKAIMEITVGDSMWEATFSAKRTTYLRYGFRYAMHKSVIDDRTTDICLQLDGTIRDLTKDKIPPMHPGCRSDIIFIKDQKA